MRYRILRPVTPIDLRLYEFDSLTALYDAAPVASECHLEQEAVDYVREVHPDAMAIPFTVEVGSGNVMLLGFVPHDAPYDAESNILFVMFVYAIPDNERDKARIKAHEQYNQHKWKAPVIRPPSCALATTHRVAVRATDLPVYAATEAKVFYRDDRMVVYMEIGGVEMSMEFLDRGVQIRTVTSG